MSLGPYGRRLLPICCPPAEPLLLRKLSRSAASFALVRTVAAVDASLASPIVLAGAWSGRGEEATPPKGRQPGRGRRAGLTPTAEPEPNGEDQPVVTTAAEQPLRSRAGRELHCSSDAP
jgi:hypothetical protein